MSAVNYINISLEIFGALLSLVILIFLSMTERKKSLQDKLFIRLLVFNSLVQLSDAAAWGFNGSPNILNGSIVYIANFICYVSGYILMAVFGDYLISFLTNADKKIVKRYSFVIWGVAITATALTVLSQFNGMYYIVDELNIYHRQNMFWLSQALGILGIVMCGVILWRFRKNLNKQEQRLIVTFIVMIPLALIVQMFTYGITFLYIATTITAICIYVFIQTEQARKFSENQLELERSKTALMLSQINPHFLYNALTSIKHIYKTNPKQGEKILVDFSDFLRGNLDSLNDIRPIPFERETQHLRHYLSIEQERFKQKLNIIYDLQTTNFMIPSLTLQPIVENAVRHGVTKKSQGGTVTIATLETETAFVIAIKDDGVGFDVNIPHDDERTHIGIDNVKNRLQSQSGASLVIDSTPGIGTTATITIPKVGAR